MARYRLFQKNPVTNEWTDRGWQEGESQQGVIKEAGVEGSTYFVVPDSSYHPVRIGTKTIATWESVEDEDVEAIPVEASG